MRKEETMHQSCDFPPSISLCFLGEYEASPYHTTPTQGSFIFFSTPLFNYHPCLPPSYHPILLRLSYNIHSPPVPPWLWMADWGLHHHPENEDAGVGESKMGTRL